MAVVAELIRNESDGTFSFGNHTLASKSKLEDFKVGGDLLKVKTYNEITKLEKTDFSSMNPFQEPASTTLRSLTMAWSLQ